MNAVKVSKVRTVRGKEIRVARERHSEFFAWKRADGTFVQTNTNRTAQWTNKGIPFVKVTSVMTTFKDQIPNALSDERDMVEQTIIGKREHCDEYLGDLSRLKGVEHTDDGAKVEWTF